MSFIKSDYYIVPSPSIALVINLYGIYDFAELSRTGESGSSKSNAIVVDYHPLTQWSEFHQSCRRHTGHCTLWANLNFHSDWLYTKNSFVDTLSELVTSNLLDLNRKQIRTTHFLYPEFLILMTYKKTGFTIARLVLLLPLFLQSTQINIFKLQGGFQIKHSILKLTWLLLFAPNQWFNLASSIILWERNRWF